MEKIVKKLKTDAPSINKMTSLSSCWELLYHIEKENIKSKQDVIILMVHLILIKNDCLCIHEEDGENKQVKLSELLPSGWNSTSSSNNHRIRYKNNGVRLHLGANLVDEVLAVNLLNLENQSTQTTVITPDTEVKELSGALEVMVPNHKELFCKIWNELVKPAFGEGQRDMNVQTEPSALPAQPSASDIHSQEIPRPFGNPRIDPFAHPRGFDPVGVGSRDLNPFMPMGPGGGMLLENPRGGHILMPDRDFPGPGRLPRGSVPPGARFDPLHPGHLGLRGPDPDHLPMPGGGSFPNLSDNMFM